MNEIQNIGNAIVAVICGLLPTVLLALPVLFLIDGEANPTLIFVVSGILGGIAIASGYFIARTILRKGAIEFFTAALASPDLDNLIPGDSSETRIVDAKELVQVMQAKGVSEIRLWDFSIPMTSGTKLVVTARFDQSEHNMTLLSDRLIISITNPSSIFLSPTYAKVLQASEINLQLGFGDQQANNSAKLVPKNKIEIQTSSARLKKKLKAELSMGTPALLIYF